MYEVLMEFMKPQVDKKIADAVSDAIHKTTVQQEAMHIIRSVEGIMAKFNTSLDNACEAIGCTPDDYEHAKEYLSAGQSSEL